jgi:deoxycytidine triphosphate deaminase
MSMKHIASPTSTSSLTNIQPKDIQPNAVDLRVSKILKINDNVFTIDEDKKIHRGSVEFEPWEDGYWYLYPGAYEIIMENKIEVGQGEAGYVITRSTLNRNGVYLTSGLYDTGYNGVMASVMHVTTGLMRIKPGTRVGQYLNFKSENIGSYDGDYGIGKEHDRKYV